MKRLWKHIPPCLSDVMGFQAVITQTDGAGIVDDPGHYKPLSFVGVEDGSPLKERRQGRPGGFPGESGAGGGRDRAPGTGEKRGGPGRGGESNITDSELRNEDIITGTEKKIIQAYERLSVKNPAFVLVSNAPSSSMIASDVETAAMRISKKGNIPAAPVDIHGDKDYLYGISATFETIAKLLLGRRETAANTVNILGCNIIDWAAESVRSFERMLRGAGLEVLGKWGAPEMSAESIKKASSAAVNLVVNVSGLSAAEYMKKEFGIPYIAGAPFGAEAAKRIAEAAKSIASERIAEAAAKRTAAGAGSIAAESIAAAAGEEAAGPKGSGSFASESENLFSRGEASSPESPAEALVIGEQFECIAIRALLRKRGYKEVRVLSFYEMSRKYFEPGDAKLSSEDELAKATAQEKLSLIVGSPDLRGAASREDIPWIELPCSGMSMIKRVSPVDMTGAALDEWLNERLSALDLS